MTFDFCAARQRVALVDGNSFYASCQMAFDPSLWHRPVVVLSNNDGCIVAANAQAKALNALLPGAFEGAMTSLMFQPYFKVAKFLAAHDAAVFSSNYELYADMSERMHRIIGQFGDQQEVYSIDESFIDLTAWQNQGLQAHGEAIKQRVWQWLSLPVAVGIAPTKTLAKLANHLAKKQAHFSGVCDLCAQSPMAQQALLQQVAVGDIWGIGRQQGKKLRSLGIETAWDLMQQDLGWLRQRFGVVMEKLVRELRGEACLSLEAVRPARKQIVSSRSFAHKVFDFETLMQAVANFVAIASEKLRQQGGVCRQIQVHIRTSPFDAHTAFYAPTWTVPLVYPSDSTVLLTKLARRALQQIYRAGLPYHKASVSLSEITPKGALQTDLFAPNPQYSANEKSDRLMKLMDHLNQTQGRGTVQLASGLGAQKTAQGEGETWQMQRNLMSRCYTTRWSELAIAKA